MSLAARSTVSEFPRFIKRHVNSIRRTSVLCIALLVLFVSAATSNAAYTSVSLQTEVPFKTFVDGNQLKLDVTTPISDSGATPSLPAVVLIHGGGFSKGDKCGHNPLAAEIALEGFVVFNINYRLAPSDHPPQFCTGTQPEWMINHTIDANGPYASNDVTSAIKWIRNQGSTYGANPSFVATYGLSAGATLAEVTGTKGTIGGGRADAVVAWSGFVSSGLNSGTWCIGHDWSCGVFERYVGCNWTVCPTSWDTASPLPRISKTTAPMDIYHGGCEELPLVGAQTLFDAITDKQREAHLTVIEGDHCGYHAGSLRYEMLPSGITAFQNSINFLHARAGAASST